MSSVTPTTVLAGASDTILTLAGSGFTTATTVAVNGTPEATTYVSATQVKATIPAAQLATATTLSVTASNGSTSDSSAAAPLVVNNPPPVVTSLSTQTLTAGSVPPAITVTGTGFVSSSSVLVNGSSRTSAFISSRQLSFTPTVQDIALPGTFALTVSNAAPGGGTSAAVNITVAAGLPTIASATPNSILTGSADTTITVTGTNFLPESVAMIGATALATTYVSSTQLTAVIPASNLASLGWLALSVHTSGNSASATVAIPVVTKLPLNINHIVYDPYNRKLWATIGASTGTLTGDSVVSIDPATGTIGTPVMLSRIPFAIALSDSGQTLYALTSNSVVRYDMTTHTVASANVPTASTGMETQNFSIVPGTENVLLLGISPFGGSTEIQVYDYDTSANTVTVRSGNAGMPSHYGYCPVFLNADYLINPYNTISDVNLYPVTSTGLLSASATYISAGEESGCMKTMGNVSYSTTGNVYAFTPTTITKSASINLSPTIVLALNGTPVAPDLSLHQVFFGTVYSGNGPEALTSASTDTNLLNSIVILPTSSITSSGGLYYSDDLYRWGQDGLALLLRDDLGTGGAILYLLRGPFVVPQKLNTNTAASITAVSSTTIPAGSGNTVLTLTGSNFVPGVAVTWNGGYRTTTIVDSTHVTVAIPASDLAAAGTSTLVATNPGAPASSSLAVQVQ